MPQTPYGGQPNHHDDGAALEVIFVVFAVWLGIAYIGDHVPIIGTILRAIF
jgi:hypothetical protein